MRNFPAIYEIFYDDKDTILIEEYILGHTCDSINFNKKLLFKTINQLLQSIEDLHSINIIHRDIKPSNIIITKDHKAYLIDYGISRFYSDTLSSDTTKSGTKGFASPEQYGFQQTDFRSDIYSIGKTIEYIVKNNNIQCNLKKIILKATAFDPKDRYENISNLSSAVKKAEYRSLYIGSSVVATLIVLVFVSIFIKTNNTKATAIPTVLNTTEKVEITEVTSKNISTMSTETYTTITTTTQNKQVNPTKKTTKTANKATTIKAEAKVNNKNVNIKSFNSDDLPFYGLIVPDGTPIMEMLGSETNKSCSIETNRTIITVNCTINYDGNNAILTVDFKDTLGHTSTNSITYTKEELENCSFPDSHSFNAYIYFYDYDKDGTNEIFINYTDNTLDHNPDGSISTFDGLPYFLRNYNSLAFVDYSKDKVFTWATNCLVSGRATLTWLYYLYNQDNLIHTNIEGSSLENFKIENNRMVLIDIMPKNGAVAN